MVSKVLVDAKIFRLYGSFCEAGHDQSYVTGLRNHRIFPVGIALTCATFMSMDVADYLKLPFAAEYPEPAERLAVENADPLVVGSWVQVIVIDNVLYDCIPVRTNAQQESA
jgi:hypothetical protein